MKIKRLLASISALAIAATGMALTAPVATAAPTVPMPLEISNKSGKSDPLYVYILGRSESGQVGWLDANGNFHQLTGAPHGTPAPVGDISIQGPTNGNTLTVSSPILTSGRIYYSYGQKLTFSKVLDGDNISNFVYPSIFNESDPNRNILHGSAEYSLVRHGDGNTGLWFNSSQVDFVGPPVQVGVQREDNSIYSIGRLKDNGLNNIISFLESKPGWGGLVKRQGGQFLRVLSAKDGLEDGALNPNTIQPYIDQVWDKYKNEDLKVKPFSGEYDMPELVYTGRVGSDNLLRFTHNLASLPQYSGNPKYASIMANPTLTYGKPTPKDVYGCEGYRDGRVTLLGSEDPAFGGVGNGGVARTMCAAYNRGVLLSNPNQPDKNPANYFKNEHANRYVEVVHAQMVSGKSYAFAFDDVGEQESLVAATNPKKAFLQLDPFTGAADPIGTEDGVGGGDNGGGSDNGGGDNGGGDTGGGDTGGGDNGGGDTGGGDTGGGDNGGGDTGGGDTGGGDSGGSDNGGGDTGGSSKPEDNTGGGSDTDTTHPDTGVGDDGKTNPQGTITIGTTLGATINVTNAPKKKRGWYRGAVVVGVSAEAPAGTKPVVQVRVNGGKWQTYTGHISVAASGKTKIRARVVAGKKASPADKLKIKVDRKSPTKLKATIKKVANKTVVKLRAKDKHSKIAKIHYRINGKGKWKAYKSAGIKVKSSVTKIAFRATDKAGNKSKKRTTRRVSSVQWSPAR